MTEPNPPVPIHPLQARLFADVGDLALAEGCALFAATLEARAAAMTEAGADSLDVALLLVTGAGLLRELQSPRWRPAAVATGVRMIRDLLLTAAPEPIGDDDTEWLDALTRSAQVRDTAHP